MIVNLLQQDLQVCCYFTAIIINSTDAVIIGKSSTAYMYIIIYVFLCAGRRSKTVEVDNGDDSNIGKILST